MSFYELLVLVHVLAAIIWVGGAIGYEIRGSRARRQGDNERVMALLREAEWTGKFVFMPASIIVLVFGIWAVIETRQWEFSNTWVSIGFTAVILSAIIGAAFLGKEAGRIVAAAEADGPTDAAVQARLNRFSWVARLDLLILLIAVWAMVAKPGS